MSISDGTMQYENQSPDATKNAVAFKPAIPVRIVEEEENHDPLKYQGIEVFLVTKTRRHDNGNYEENSEQHITDQPKISAEHYMKRRKLIDGSWYAA